MARFGALMLASVLLGLPRIFRPRTLVVRQRSRYETPALSDLALLEFIAALKPAIDEHCSSLAKTRGGGAIVIEVHRLLSQPTQAGLPPAEAVSVSVETDGHVQRLIVRGAADRRANAARALVAWLAGGGHDASSARAHGARVHMC